MEAVALQPQSAPDKIACPRCNRWIESDSQLGRHDRQGKLACSNCKWSGEVWFHDPLPMQFALAEEALNEDARCVVHPTKKAAAVCAGTGDYICSLCSIQVDDQTYSAGYIDEHGKEKIEARYNREIARPDRLLVWMLVLCFFPYPMIAVPVAIPIGCYQWWKMVKQRRANESYRSMVGMTSVFFFGLLYGALFISMIVGFGFLLVAIMEEFI